MTVEAPPSGVVTEWAGDNPFCLIIKPDVGSAVLIDLDRKGWLEDFSHLMRVSAHWILARKQGSVPVLMLNVTDGEQPYYTARHYTAFLPPKDAIGREIDMATLKEKASVKIFGIGKKRVGGQVDRLWVLPNGSICTGDDDGPLADQLAKARLAAVLAQAKQESTNGHHDGRHGGGGQAQEREVGTEADREVQEDAGAGGRDPARGAGDRRRGRNG